jgi:demethylmenaquinone methyltransferase/2-methoxy-6-polyprenyl-1,4-benzoquinol methylase
MNAPAKLRSVLPGSRPAGADSEAAAARQVRDMFSGIAPHYDLLNHLLSLRFDILWRKRAARRFRPILSRPGARVLDLCCGTGDMTLALASESLTAGETAAPLIMGSDFARPMLTRARDKARSHAAGARVAFVEADALALPFVAESFDLVTAAFGFRNLSNYRAGLAELQRVLRRGGSVGILEFSEPRNALFGALFGLYFRRVLPQLGGIISGNLGAYSYLPSSVGRFPPPPELGRMMRETGFTGVSYSLWTGGIVALHSGRRQD